MTYQIECTCKRVQISLAGKPKVRAYCHCSDCRNLLGIPFHSVTAWDATNVSADHGEDHIAVFQHPTLSMQKHCCRSCCDVLFNTNSLEWRIVSQQIIARSNNGKLPKELTSTKHFFYEQRVISIDDDLPKFLRGTDGPMLEQDGK